MEPVTKVRVWDLPVRIFHWLLVVLIAFQYVSYKVGGIWMVYHMWSGYAILALILFRIIWGFVGSTHARFSDFLYGPRAIFRYIKTLPSRTAAAVPGHNPLGGWSVLVMLLLALLQAGTGLFANDDIDIEGPLAVWVRKSTSDYLSTIHRYNFYVLLSFIAVHVMAVLYYFFYKSHNLIAGMFTGHKHLPASAAKPGARIAGTGLAVAVMAVAAAIVYLLVRQWK